jgi:phosphoglycolate phosphatase
MNYSAVIFDLDGTLLDTLDDLGDSMNAVLASLGYPVHAMEGYKYFVGDGVENLVRRTLPEPVRGNDELVRETVPRMRAEYARRWRDKTRLYDGVAELLDGLTGRGVRMAILSNKPHSAVLEVVDHFFKAWRFQVVFGARPEVPNKPDPASALEVCGILGLAPEKVLYLGDTNTDMQTANAAGMFPVGALWGFRTEAELLESGAGALVSHPREVLELL